MMKGLSLLAIVVACVNADPLNTQERYIFLIHYLKIIAIIRTEQSRLSCAKHCIKVVIKKFFTRELENNFFSMGTLFMKHTVSVILEPFFVLVAAPGLTTGCATPISPGNRTSSPRSQSVTPMEDIW